MKAHKLIFVSLVALLTFSFSACVYAPASYSCDVDTVESAQIIKLGAWNEETQEQEFIVLVNIADVSAFVERLNNLKDNDFFFIFGSPDVMFEGDIIIKVNYFNGDYDLLKESRQYFCRSGIYKAGRVTFDREQFKALIDDYLTETESIPVS
ncbi:MAG: hypothetical protein E7461_06895 [Ruminococcaceae bacterium]|nr:hypothetical protein [Oscillospiraceae bacterium]